MLTLVALGVGILIGIFIGLAWGIHLEMKEYEQGRKR